MAARTIILNMPDAKAAAEFAKAMLKAQTSEIPLETAAMPYVPKGATIEALIARPSLGCECSGGGKKDDGWTYFPTFGWWLHPRCKRPSMYIIRHWISNHLGGCRNLMADIAPDQEWAQPILGIDPRSERMRSL
jgi:hypothetical protein